jgi:hypothetical protein
MENSIENKTPWWFWTVSGVFLLWNLMGIGAYIMDMQSSPEKLVKNYGQATADAFMAQPSWVIGAYAVAVFAGALGCLLLLLRKRVALWALAVSLLGVIAQQIYWWGITGFAATQGGSYKVMNAMIVIGAIVLVWFARKMIARGLLK